VFDAFAIYNALRRYAGKVTARIDACPRRQRASWRWRATRRDAENAMLMIHTRGRWPAGSAADLRSTARHDGQGPDGILAAYRSKSGQSDEDIVAMMDAETWLTALEAQALGFCDVIEDPVRCLHRPRRLTARAFQEPAGTRQGTGGCI